MSLLALPWLELAVALLAGGAVAVGRVRDPMPAARGTFAVVCLAFALTLLEWVRFAAGVPVTADVPGAHLFQADALTALLIPAVALLHVLTVLGTARTKMRRFGFARMLAAEAARVAAFGAHDPRLFVALLSLTAAFPAWELAGRGRSTRAYALHFGLFTLLLLGGQSLSEAGGDLARWGVGLFALAALLRVGVVPLHGWLTDLVEKASFGTSQLFLIPGLGVLAAVRLVLPTAPGWMLEAMAGLGAFSAVYAAALACVQADARRFFAYVVMSHSALILVGLGVATRVSLTGAFALWVSVILAVGGFGLTLRALEARYGPLSLARYLGLYDQAPALAVGYILSGLASIGFPGTVGFVAAEMLVDGVVEESLLLGLAVVLASALNGIAMLRAYFLLFTGAEHRSTIDLRVGRRERVAILTTAALILGLGLYPQPGVASRYAAALAELAKRGANGHGGHGGE